MSAAQIITDLHNRVDVLTDVALELLAYRNQELPRPVAFYQAHLKQYGALRTNTQTLLQEQFGVNKLKGAPDVKL